MHIIHFITTLERGGAEHGVCSLAITQAEHGSIVSLVPLKGRAELTDHLNANGVKVELFLLNKPFVIQILLASLFLMNKRSSVTHAHLPRAEILLSLSIFWRKRVSTRHNSESFIPTLPGLISRTLSRLCLINSTLVSISSGVKDYLIASGEVSKNKSSVVIHYGYSPRFGEISKRPKNSKAQVWRIGTIARLEKQKNIETLLYALTHLKDLEVSFDLSIIGDGSERKYLQQLVRQLQLEKQVVFLGKTHDVYSHLVTWDVFVLPSHYEGFGLSLLEAIDCGVLVIASDIPTSREVLGIHHPYLFNPRVVNELKSCLERIVTAKEPLHDTVVRQRDRLGLFSTHACYRLHDSIYKGLLNPQNQPSY